MLGRGAIVVEGVTEFHALPVIARKLEEADSALRPLDTAGVAFFDAESDGPMPKFGTFFKALGLKTFSFYDHKKRKPEDKEKFTRSFDVDCEHSYAGVEALVAAEVPVDRLWTFLADLRASGETGKVWIPAQRPADEAVKEITKQALLSHKGAGWAARLFESCTVQELPATVTGFLKRVYEHFPKPSELPPVINEESVSPR
jgi:putative ATP-dependent endonuclease of OLD family